MCVWKGETVMDKHSFVLIVKKEMTVKRVDTNILLVILRARVHSKV